LSANSNNYLIEKEYTGQENLKLLKKIRGKIIFPPFINGSDSNFTREPSADSYVWDTT